MAHLDPLRQLKENNKKIRIMVSLTKTAYEALLRLNQQEPDKNASTIISDSLRFSENMDIYRPLRERLQGLQMQVGATPVKDPNIIHKAKAGGQKEWCELYGGTCDGNNCRFLKYEVLTNGEVIENSQMVPLRMMPKEQDDFRKMILGGFITPAHAKSAFENQEPRSGIKPVRMLGKKVE